MTPAAGSRSLVRALSRAGAATRTEAEALVAAGRVTVNGRAASSPAQRVDPGRDRIEVDGAPLAAPPAAGEAVVVAINKPRGFVVTRAHPHGRGPAVPHRPAAPGLLRFVGRLDAASAGLILATTDTGLAAALENPANAVPRVYRVKVKPRPGAKELGKLREGTVIDGRGVRPGSVILESENPKSAWLVLVLAEGRNREIRRLAAGAGLAVEHLVRVSYGPVALGDLAPGAHRLLSAAEVRALRAATGSRPSGTSRPRSSR